VAWSKRVVAGVKAKTASAPRVKAKAASSGRVKAKTASARVKAKATSSAGVDATLRWLERAGTRAVREGMARYAIPSDKAFGVPVGQLRAYAKRLGRDHALAEALWQTDRYEARMLATFLDEPSLVSSAQMDRWCRDFDNWAICDTACFHLFDRTPHAWKRLAVWARRKDEFVKRAAFALLASLSVHDKRAGDAAFLDGLALIEGAAQDPRNFVKKSVNWALRSVGKRNRVLNAASIAVAARLAASPDATSRWCGKDALRELESAALARRLAAR
jgi:3-methyladenine DNA glycosylase AlkD